MEYSSLFEVLRVRVRRTPSVGGGTGELEEAEEGGAGEVATEVEDLVRGLSSRVGVWASVEPDDATTSSTKGDEGGGLAGVARKGRGRVGTGGEDWSKLIGTRWEGASERVRRRGVPPLRGRREGDGEGVRARSSRARGGRSS